MKVGIITFHAAHNYGSMLQAYALQQVVTSLGHDCRIINLRTPRQKKFYSPFYLKGGLRSKIKAIAYPAVAVNDWRKSRLFEKFLRTHLLLTPTEYSSSEQLRHASLDFDIIISGSDQIWNTCCFDHEPAYFLDFCNDAKRVAYAPSMGPDPENQVEPRLYPMLAAHLRRYDAIAVREQRTASIVSRILADGTTPPTVLDPTLLLPTSHWSHLAGDTPIISGDYIFVYTPWLHQQLYAKAESIAQRTGMTVICSSYHFYHQWHRRPHFRFYTAVGPIEFLNLFKFSRFVVCGSFHAVAFAILFGKPFYVLDGMADGRIAPLLSDLSIKHCASLSDDLFSSSALNFNASALDAKRVDSLEFISKALA